MISPIFEIWVNKWDKLCIVSFDTAKFSTQPNLSKKSRSNGAMASVVILNTWKKSLIDLISAQTFVFWRKKYTEPPFLIGPNSILE